jgi:tetratricopeptide (TPR) repeat protein
MKQLHYSLIAAMLFIPLSGCGSSSDSAADFINSGKALVQEGKLQKARLEFKNAIQIDPRTADAFYQLALLDEKSQEWKSMYAQQSAQSRPLIDFYDRQLTVFFA